MYNVHTLLAPRYGVVNFVVIIRYYIRYMRRDTVRRTKFFTIIIIIICVCVWFPKLICDRKIRPLAMPRKRPAGCRLVETGWELKRDKTNAFGKQPCAKSPLCLLHGWYFTKAYAPISPEASVVRITIAVCMCTYHVYVLVYIGCMCLCVYLHWIIRWLCYMATLRKTEIFKLITGCKKDGGRLLLLYCTGVSMTLKRRNARGNRNGAKNELGYTT